VEAGSRDATLPAVAYVQPGPHDDGRDDVPAFEAFIRHIVHAVQVNRKLWATTAILITIDDAGDSYDAGYVQPLDAAGDGPRVPLLIVSPYTINAGVRHNYADHASVVKFIEANWGLTPIGPHGRDALPNPVVIAAHPYVPTNIPAIGNLMDFFNFPDQD
jgi:phospholipase C